MKRLAIPGALILFALLEAMRLRLGGTFLFDSATLYVETGLIALGMTFVIACGQIDLSVGSNMVLTGCLTAKLLALGASIPAAICFALLLGTILGAANGLLVVWGKIPSFLVTLGTMALYRGIAQAMMGPGSIKLPKQYCNIDESLLFGVPWPVVIFLAFAFIAAMMIHQTVFGRWVFAVGTSEVAAEYSAVPVRRVQAGVFALTGFLCGLGALLLTSRLGVARYDLAQGVELDSITVVVVGGASIFGGRGSIVGSALALILIGLVKTEMVVAGVKAEYQLTAVGVLLIMAVTAGKLESLSIRRAKLSAPASKSISGS